MESERECLGGMRIFRRCPRFRELAERCDRINPRVDALDGRM